MDRSTLVLMGTYNGSRFLGGQLASIAVQAPGRVDLMLSDDGSSDDTLAIVENAVGKWKNGKIAVSRGPGEGFPENYRQMIINAASGYDAYAFADQDDIWHLDKLSRAFLWLDSIDPKTPAVYCGRTLIVDAKGRQTGLSPLFTRKPSFHNAIVQSIAGGNTMVMNAAARDLLAEASSRAPFVTHDWWTYLVVSGAGGVMNYDPEPSVDYRQHDDNLIGANSTWSARMVRLILMAGGRFAKWNDQNIKALRLCGDLLTSEALKVLDDFEEIRATGSISTSPYPAVATPARPAPSATASPAP